MIKYMYMCGDNACRNINLEKVPVAVYLCSGHCILYRYFG